MAIRIYICPNAVRNIEPFSNSKEVCAKVITFHVGESVWILKGFIAVVYECESVGLIRQYAGWAWITIGNVTFSAEVLFTTNRVAKIETLNDTPLEFRPADRGRILRIREDVEQHVNLTHMLVQC
jgi:hypothetical protein